jgi:hypothetical protein
MMLGLPRLPAVPRDWATRLMCSAVHLNHGFARDVLAEFDERSLRAVAPSFGYDAVAAVAHAHVSHMRWVRFDRQVVAVRATVVASVVGAAVMAVGFGTGVAAIPGLTVLVAALAAGWNRGYVALREARAAALDALEAPGSPRDRYHVLSEPYRHWLDIVARPDLVIFSKRLAAPFTGSGEYLFHHVMPPVDLSLGARDCHGNTVKPTPFDPQDLHRYIAGSVRQIGLDDVAISERLYVRGDVIPFSLGLWPHRSMRPGGLVGRAWLDAGIACPAEQARTYLCMEKSFGGGLVYVTLFVRAGRQSDMLTLEIAGFALPPPRAEFGALPPVIRGHFGTDLRPLRGRSERVATLAASWRMVLRRLTSGPWKPHSSSTLAEWYEAELERQREAIKEGRSYDFGALVGLREKVAQDGITEYFDAVDLEDCLLRMQRGVVDCMSQFLADHNIDTTEFTKRQEQIIHNYAGDVYDVKNYGGSQNVGSGGTINSDGDSEAAARRGRARAA